MAPKPALGPDIDDDELAAICAAEAASALGSREGDGSTLSADRTDALDYYFGDMSRDMPVTGPDRSKAVSRDVMDVVEGLLPELMEVFAGTDDICRFEAQSNGDEGAARQETDVVNHVIMERNEGFKIVYDWLKDGLLSKNGFVKWWWDDGRRQEIETYHGIDDLQFAQIGEDPDVEIVRHRVYAADAPEPDQPETAAPGEDPTQAPAPGNDGAAPIDPGIGAGMTALAAAARPITPDAALGMMAPPARPPVDPVDPVDPVAPPPVMMHDVVVKRSIRAAQVRIVNIPPEEVAVSRSWRGGSLRDAPYVNHRRKCTASDLIEMGIPRAKVDLIPDAAWDDTPEAIARSRVQENDAQAAKVAKSQRTLDVVEHYVRADVDGDGRSELLHVMTAGASNTVLLKEYADNICMASWSPVRVPHRGFGLSMADLVMDYQRIKTSLLRVLLDNAYFTTNAVLDVPDTAQSDFTIDDVLRRRPGGIVRSKVAGQITPIVTPPLVGQLLPVLETMDARQEMRTGYTRNNQGLGADSLNKTATGISLLTTAGQKRQKLIARLFSEVGLKDLFLGVHETMLKNDRHQTAIQLRGKWVNVNPREWKRRTELKVSVGIGPGTQQQQIGFLQGILALQTQALQMQGGHNGPMVYLPNIHNTATKMIEAMGYRSADPFVAEPTAPHPEMMVAEKPPGESEAKLIAEGEKAKAMIGADKDARIAAADNATKVAIAKIQAETDIAIARMKIDADREAAQLKLITDAHGADQDRAHDREKADADRAHRSDAENLKTLAGAFTAQPQGAA